MSYLSSMVTDKKRIQVYVDLSTYESLKSLAEDGKMSLSKAAGEILQAYSMNDYSFDNVSNDYSCLTRNELISMLEELRRQVISEINKLRVQNEGLSKFEKTNEGVSKSQKKKRRGFAK